MKHVLVYFNFDVTKPFEGVLSEDGEFVKLTNGELVKLSDCQYAVIS